MRGLVAKHGVGRTIAHAALWAAVGHFVRRLPWWGILIVALVAIVVLTRKGRTR